MNPRVFITNPRLTITDPFEKNSTPKAKRSQAQHKLHVHLQVPSLFIRNKFPLQIPLIKWLVVQRYFTSIMAPLYCNIYNILSTAYRPESQTNHKFLALVASVSLIIFGLQLWRRGYSNGSLSRSHKLLSAAQCFLNFCCENILIYLLNLIWECAINLCCVPQFQ